MSAANANSHTMTPTVSVSAPGLHSLREAFTTPCRELLAELPAQTFQKGSPFEKSVTAADVELIRGVEEIVEKKSIAMMPVARVAWVPSKVSSPIVSSSVSARIRSGAAAQTGDYHCGLYAGAGEIKYLEEPSAYIYQTLDPI
ncbi:hypothetical protein H0H92_005132 [Tricholoma furcatifolium]|nr:hypothetical protein H0H92_005132 [Tricholoma furcatifolium]